MQRPLGIMILAAAMILAGLASVAAGVIFFFMGSAGATATAPESGAAATLAAALGAAGGILCLLFGGIQIVLAIGIFQLRPLARILSLFLFVLISAGAGLGLAATLLSYSHVALLWNVSILAVVFLAFWYLWRADTKEVFSRVARGS